ncbi:class I SAM-dependent methyltransferase [Achromobacter xylosoxidans]|uniref:Methyltransferase n=1 Tax=Alcaligenes xylosoxydans xylosoxydans TaxID=85698 RepID=A0A1R1JWK4_ALCXX|nr:class I SAM-dependent methyltransferase [Achromobacter xylosoxidans]OMG90354.1 methyltransferase [Achromobacter xylosoxidans]BEG73814.1 Carboxy-S-adenosyl-L-methionine synthase [Achromobacter xylosoxidans]
MSFANTPGASQDYAERVARHVPGLRDLHRMIGLLMAEQAPDDGRFLVLGAGGGLELKALAETRPGWRLDGVDPSADMLRQASATLGELAPRAVLHQGYIDDAPEGPFDGATCLLTLHFLPAAERLRTVREVARRLKPGAPFIAAHHSFPLERRDTWLARNAAFVVAAGVPAEQARSGMQAMKEKLPVLAPEADEALLREAGFSDVELFYAALTFKGWVCRKA